MHSRTWLKLTIAFALSLPLVWLLWAVIQESRVPGDLLGADPAKEVVDFLGGWSIRILLAVLLVSTLRRRLNWPAIMASRRMIGLFAFTYVILHITAYVGLLSGFELSTLIADLTERRYIIVGAVALVALIPLAVTSTNGWRRRLGRRWVQLHRLVYLILPLALVHLWWLTKDGFAELVAYTLAFAVLMLERPWFKSSIRAVVSPSKVL